MKFDVFCGKVGYKLDMARVFARYCVAYAVSGLLKNRPEYKDLWLISERGDDAGDNAWHLYRYLRTFHPEINLRYVITDDSPDAAKVKALGKTIRFGSWGHYMALALARVLVSTHVLGYTPHDYLFQRFSRWGMLRGKQIFLQHGVTKDDMKSLHYEVNSPDVFVCAVPQEAEFVHTCFHQPESAVRMIGFCRFDALPLPNERPVGTRIILMMPTWRKSLFFYSEKNFQETLYYKSWKQLLSSSRLQQLLEARNYKVIFYPHHQMQKFVHLFRSTSDRVIIASKEEYEVQKLLIDADILVTDFSSVFFDYAYMQKPVVFFQFDQEIYRKRHYQEGWFSYERDGGGKVVLTAEEVLEELEAVIERDGRIAPLYWERNEILYPYRDHNNCKRNYEAILDVLNQPKG